MSNRKIRIVIGAGIVLAAGFLLSTYSSAQEELDSLKVCSGTQKLILENSLVRVIDDRIPVGVTEAKHRHAHGITIALTDYDIEQKTYPQGSTTRSHRRFGEVNWGEPVVHEVHNVGQTPSHAIRIELK
jgi:hypothetical protein